MVMVVALPLVVVMLDDISVPNEALRTCSIPADTEVENVTLSVTLCSLDHVQVDPPGRPAPMLCRILGGLALTVWTPYSKEVS